MVMEKVSLWIFAGNFAPNLMADLGVKNNQYRLENCVMAREMEIFAKFVAN